MWGVPLQPRTKPIQTKELNPHTCPIGTFTFESRMKWCAASILQQEHEIRTFCLWRLEQKRMEQGMFAVQDSFRMVAVKPRSMSSILVASGMILGLGKRPRNQRDEPILALAWANRHGNNMNEPFDLQQQAPVLFSHMQISFCGWLHLCLCSDTL